MYAEVLIEYPTKKIDKYFTYIIPNELKNIIDVGMKVRVPFASKEINGFVMNIFDTYSDEYELKEIIDIIDPELKLNEELMKLGEYISNETLCPKIMAYQTMLPSSLKIKDKKHDYNHYDTYIELIDIDNTIKYLDSYKKINKQTELLEYLINNNRILKKECSFSVIKSLKDKGLIKEIKIQAYRINNIENYELKKNKLNDEQNRIYEKIINSKKNETFLLEGVTGSGKTEIYLHIINNVIKAGKTAICLVPEISLTHQIVERFYDWFGSNVAILHSALSNGEKNDEYLKILRKEVSVVVGTRSAIFAPLENIGVIIIDEAHSDTYKQDNTPKYNAIEIAIKRSEYHNIPIILGSATPTLEMRARAIKGVFTHLKLTKRVGNGLLPKVRIIDMMSEVKKKNYIFSEYLLEKLNECLENKEQAMILLNRRGYSTTINCSNCGYTYKCPNCDITLTYHKTTNNLRCHYCGYTKKKDEICPECHEKGLNYLGLGTEKVEVELNKILPNARIIRMDQDTTRKKGSYDNIIKDFKEYKYDILLGTQMISKGFDFDKVTLVGILNADNTLNIPDFRSNERCFSLFYQASGRAGRREKQGNVIIQTFNPDNNILNFLKYNDFDSFYNYEMNIRRMLKYPPYYYLCSIKVISSSYDDAINEANKVVEYLKKNIDSNSIILGPTTANLFKLNGNYRFQIVIKYRFDKKLFNALKYLDSIYINNNKVNIDIDINPLNI